MIVLSKILSEIQEEMHLFHGTRHDIDCFRLDKIGAGAGAQVYGFGIYLSKNKLTSLGYAKMGHVAKPEAADKHILGNEDINNLVLKYDNLVFERIPRGLRTVGDMIEYAKDIIELCKEEDPELTHNTQEKIKDYTEFIEILEREYIDKSVNTKKGINPDVGYLFNVVLNKGLKVEDYDLLSDSTQITERQKQKILNYAFKKDKDFYNDIKTKLNTPNKLTGYTVYKIISTYYKNDYDASMFLRYAGIDGNIIGDGNIIIIFNPHKLQIVDKCEVNLKK